MPKTIRPVSVVRKSSRPRPSTGPEARQGPSSEFRTRLLARYRVQVLERALGMLDVLATAERELGPADLAATLNLHKSTIHRLLKVLEFHRLIRRNPQGKYDLGLKLFELGNRSVSRFNLPKRAEPFLRALVKETGETAHICVLSNTEMLSIANAEASWILRTVGHRGQMHCSAAGKALLAFLPPAAREDLISRLALTRYTRNTIIKPAALSAELARIHKRGFALNDEEVEAGVRCLAAPLFDHKGRVIATVSVAGPVFRMSKERLPELTRAVMSAAEGLSAELGYLKHSAS